MKLKWNLNKKRSARVDTGIMITRQLNPMQHMIAYNAQHIVCEINEQSKNVEKCVFMCDTSFSVCFFSERTYCAIDFFRQPFHWTRSHERVALCVHAPDHDMYHIQ